MEPTLVAERDHVDGRIPPSERFHFGEETNQRRSPMVPGRMEVGDGPIPYQEYKHFDPQVTELTLSARPGGGWTPLMKTSRTSEACTN